MQSNSGNVQKVNIEENCIQYNLYYIACVFVCIQFEIMKVFHCTQSQME